MVVVALVVGLGAGLGGALLGANLGADEQEAPPPAPTPAPDTQAQLRFAVDRVYPNVVLIIADQPDRRDEQGRVYSRRNVGSGVVVSQAGHILTNAHVVEGASELSVVLPSGERRPARLVSDDSPFTDLAILSVPPQGLRQVAFGSSAELKPGELVAAVTGGTGAFGAGNAVSFGVVSATDRALARSGYILEDLIQTDAAVNSGDSGGALINLRGEFVGLITTVVREAANGEPVQGVAFAQSADSLRPIVADIVRNGKHPRPRTGIERPNSQHIEITPELAAQRRLPVQAGALVIAPAPNSPAARAGVQPGDIIIGLNGAAVSLERPLVNLLKLLPPGARVDLLVLRAGRQLVIPVSPED